MSRIPALIPADMSEAQHRIYSAILSSRGGSWFHGPYDALLLQPHIAEPAQQLGEFVRFRTSLGPRLSELAILVVARHCDCEFEWHQHAPIAARSDVAPDIIEALRQGNEPSSMQEDERIVYEFTSSLLKRHRIHAELYDQAKQRFGPVGVVELTGLIGYYTFLAYTLNAHEIELPVGSIPAFAKDRPKTQE